MMPPFLHQLPARKALWLNRFHGLLLVTSYRNVISSGDIQCDADHGLERFRPEATICAGNHILRFGPSPDGRRSNARCCLDCASPYWLSAAKVNFAINRSHFRKDAAKRFLNSIRLLSDGAPTVALPPRLAASVYQIVQTLPTKSQSALQLFVGSVISVQSQSRIASESIGRGKIRRLARDIIGSQILCGLGSSHIPQSPARQLLRATAFAYCG